MTVLHTSDAPFGDAMLELGRSRDDVVVLTADLAKWTDIRPFADEFPDRFFQMGMAEQNLIGTAAGMAKAGLRPFAVSFGVFATRRAYDQIANSMATGPTNAVIVGFLPGITARFPATHQAFDDVALMRAIPGMTVLDPADATELHEAAFAAADHDGPVYIRARRGGVERIFEPSGFSIGPTRHIATGTDIGVISSGFATCWMAEAMAQEPLASRSVDHLHVPTIKPLDTDAIVEFCRRHRTVVVVENHSVIGGLGEAVGVTIARGGLGTRLVQHAVPDEWGQYGQVPYLRQYYRFDAEGLAQTIDDVISEGAAS